MGFMEKLGEMREELAESTGFSPTTPTKNGDTIAKAQGREADEPGKTFASSVGKGHFRPVPNFRSDEQTAEWEPIGGEEEEEGEFEYEYDPYPSDDELANAEAKIQDLTTEVENLNQQLNAANAANAEAEYEIEGLTYEVEKLKQQLADAEAEVKAAEAKASQAKTEAVQAKQAQTDAGKAKAKPAQTPPPPKRDTDGRIDGFTDMEVIDFAGSPYFFGEVYALANGLDMPRSGLQSLAKAITIWSDEQQLREEAAATTKAEVDAKIAKIKADAEAEVKAAEVKASQARAEAAQAKQAQADAEARAKESEDLVSAFRALAR